MWFVKRCVQDFNEVFRTVVAEFATEQEAWEFAEREDSSHAFRDVWHVVEEQ
jgi:hypothetical protein